MPYLKEHAYRVNSPEKYKRIRRVNNEFGDGIHAIFGVLYQKDDDGNDKTEVQAIRFDMKKFTVAEAKKWLVEHDYPNVGRLEPAVNNEKDTLRMENVFKSITEYAKGILTSVTELGAGKETDWIPYFGINSTPNGHRFSREDLIKLAVNYNPNLWKSPVIIGHTSAAEDLQKVPAYGYISRMRFNEETERLEFKLGNLSDELEEAIKAGRYTGFSFEICNETPHPLNPPYVTAIAILGSALPAEPGSYIDITQLAFQPQTEKQDDYNNTQNKEPDMADDKVKIDFASKYEEARSERDKLAGELKELSERMDKFAEIKKENSELKKKIRGAQFKADVSKFALPPVVSQALDELMNMFSDIPLDDAQYTELSEKIMNFLSSIKPADMEETTPDSENASEDKVQTAVASYAKKYGHIKETK